MAKQGYDSLVGRSCWNHWQNHKIIIIWRHHQQQQRYSDQPLRVIPPYHDHSLARLFLIVTSFPKQKQSVRISWCSSNTACFSWLLPDPDRNSRIFFGRFEPAGHGVPVVGGTQLGQTNDRLQRWYTRGRWTFWTWEYTLKGKGKSSEPIHHFHVPAVNLWGCVFCISHLFYCFLYLQVSWVQYDMKNHDTVDGFQKKSGNNHPTCTKPR